MNTSNFNRLGFVNQYGAFMVRLGRVVDSLLILCSLYLIARLEGIVWDVSLLVYGLFAIITFQFITSFFELYRSWRIVRLRNEFIKLLGYWSITYFITLMLALFYSASEFGGRLFIDWFLLAYCLMVISRTLTRILMRHVRAIGYDHKRAAFVGYNEISRNLFGIFTRHQWMGVDVVGYFDDRSADNVRLMSDDYEKLSGNSSDLVRIAREGKADCIYMCLPMAAEKRIKQLIDLFSDTTVSIYY